MARYEITVDTRKGPWVGDPVRVRVGDVGSCVIVAHVTEGSAERRLDGLTARFECLKPDGTVVRDSECVVEGSTITHTLAKHVAQYPGECAAAYFSLVNADGTLVDSTQSFALVVQDGTGTGGVSSDYISDINQLMALLEAQRQRYDEAERARATAEEDRVLTEADRAIAEDARAKAEAARVDAERARAAAEGKRAGAEAKRGEEEAARSVAEAQRASDEEARATAEGQRAKAESARQSSESTRDEAERARVAAETARTADESARTTAEEARAQAEAGRSQAEVARATAETGRGAAETTRTTAEEARAQAEAERAAAEELRKTAEGARAAAEEARDAAEEARHQAEASRAKAEASRAAAEAERDAAQAKNNSDQKANNAAAFSRDFTILKAGEYDPETSKPTIDGQNGKIYLAPDKDGTEDNLYREWIWEVDRWECIGSTAMRFDPITTDTIDAVAAGDAPSGNEGLNTTGLSYLWAKVKAAFAPLSHRHIKADITDFPTALPASDVSAWAKAAQKPAYTPAEVGAAAASHTHAMADVTGLAGAVAALQPRSSYATVTISTADWSGNECAKAVDGMTADAVVSVGAAPESEEAASAAHVWCSAQAAGSLSFRCETAPTVAVTLNIEFKEA